MKRIPLVLLLIVFLFYPAESSDKLGEQKKLRVHFVDPAGNNIPASQIRRFHCRDLSDEPCPTRTYVHDGYATVILPNKPIQVCALIKVPDFGEVTLYADRRGKGFVHPGDVDFIAEAAVTRIMRVTEAVKQAEREGVRMPEEFYARLDEAKQSPPYKSLALALRAGEEVTLARARHRIAQFKEPRRDFYFGCNSFGHPTRGPDYDRRFREIFNFGIPNLYLSHYAPDENVRDFARTDLEVEWLNSMGMAIKPCPPFYIAASVTPDWLKNKPYAYIKKAAYSLVKEVCARYAGKAQFCEIVNEAHDYSNALRLSPAELTNLAKVCSIAARDGDPKVLRIINSCHLWGEYAAKPSRTGQARRSPFAYIRDCIRYGVNFEIIGLQMYYPEYDLLEIDRLLERYSTFGKPIHITEMGCSSAPGIDPNAQRKKATAGWRGEWTEEMQADWVEAIYTICYSKPYVQAICWWDLADAVSFWPYGGLLRGDLSPKPAFFRLKSLEEKWGYHFGSQ